MKKALCLLLCLALGLAAPLSAFSEPLPWLQPWLNRAENTQSSEAALTVQIDPEALITFADRYIDLQLESYQNLAKSFITNYGDEEEDETAAALYDEYLKSVKQSFAAQRAAWKTYVPAVAALADSAEIVLHTGEYFSSFELRIDGKTWCTLNMIFRPEEGDWLLTSDLFPSCALQVLTLNSGDIYTALSDAFGVTYDDLLAAEQELLLLLPELDSLDLTGQYYAAYAQALNLLEAEGKAHREGDALVYEVTYTQPDEQAVSMDKILGALFERGALNVDERLYRLRHLFTLLEAFSSASVTSTFWEEEGADPTLPVLGDDATDADYANAASDYIRLLYRNRVLTTTVTERTTLNGDEITWESTTTISTHYNPVEADEGTLEKLLERYSYLSFYFNDSESTTQSAWRRTPSAYEFHRQPSDYREEIYRVDTGAENEILFSYTDYYYYAYGDDTEQTAELRLTRTDEGQHWVLTLPSEAYFYDDGEPADIRVTLSFDNDLTRMDFTLSALGQNLLRARADCAYAGEPAAAPDVSSLTLIPSGDGEAMKFFYQDLRTVGIPSLIRLIMGSLPEGTKGLTLPLLKFTTMLGNLGD